MMDCIERLCARLSHVTTAEEFENWARRDLRRVLPHAMLVGTMGRSLGIGSVPTHRIGVDCPLNLIEAQKNAAGALDDPLMFRWLRSGKPSCINVMEISDKSEQRQWRRTMLRYGIKAMSIHGFLDHSRGRFAAFQLGNPFGGGSVDNLKLLSAISNDMADAAWRTIETRSNELSRGTVCNPTLGLTATELHIVELVAQGMSNKEIARRRGVSDSTIKTQIQRTGAKLGATRRAEIVAVAMPMLSGLPAQALIDYDD